ncbi:MAG: UbiA family prenyltransferase [bacterium]
MSEARQRRLGGGRPGRGSPLVRLVDVVFLARPPLLCASAAFFLVGSISSLRSTTGCYRVSLMLPALHSLGLYLLVVAFAFVVNQIFDIKSDAINKKNFILPSGAVTRAEAAAFAATLAGAVIYLGRNETGAVATLLAAGLLLGLAYSVPPVRLKAKPFADLAANVAGFGWIGFVMGWLVFSRFGGEVCVRAIPYVVSMAAIFLNTCIPDEEGDRQARDRTTCVILGRRMASLAAVVLMSSAAGAGIVVDEPICAAAALGSIPGLVAVAVRPTPANSVLASQLAARILFVLVSVCAPVLAGIGAVTYATSRIYYAKRFGLKYPSMTGAAALEGRGPER